MEQQRPRRSFEPAPQDAIARLAEDLRADIRAAGSQVAIDDQWLAWSRKDDRP